MGDRLDFNSPVEKFDVNEARASSRFFSNAITGNYMSAIELSVFHAGTKITPVSTEERGVPQVNAREMPVSSGGCIIIVANCMPSRSECRWEARCGVGKLGTKLFRLRESLLKHAICETRMHKVEKYEWTCRFLPQFLTLIL